MSSSKRDQFVKLAKDFVMVNLEDDDEPEDEKYAPDGRYIPRLYFLGKIDQNLRDFHYIQTEKVTLFQLTTRRITLRTPITSQWFQMF